MHFLPVKALGGGQQPDNQGLDTQWLPLRPMVLHSIASPFSPPIVLVASGNHNQTRRFQTARIDRHSDAGQALVLLALQTGGDCGLAFCTTSGVAIWKSQKKKTSEGLAIFPCLDIHQRSGEKQTALCRSQGIP